jgi:hypothetical protein
MLALWFRPRRDLSERGVHDIAYERHGHHVVREVCGWLVQGNRRGAPFLASLPPMSVMSPERAPFDDEGRGGWQRPWHMAHAQ